MVPLYSVGSWLSLRFHDFALYFGAVRDAYEAYVIYCFFYYLVSLLGGEEQLRETLKASPVRRATHPVPVKWFLRPWLIEPLPMPPHHGIRWVRVGRGRGRGRSRGQGRSRGWGRGQGQGKAQAQGQGEGCARTHAYAHTHTHTHTHTLFV